MAADDAKKEVKETAEQRRAKPAGKKGETITVRGPATGRRRAGLGFDANPKDVDLSTITVGQLEDIEADPLLSVKHN